MSFVAIPKPHRSPLPYQILLVLTGSLVLFFLAIGIFTGGFRLFYTERILPGVSVAGVDLSRMPLKDASAALSQHLIFPYKGRIVLREEDQIWVATPAELGMVFDIGASVQEAYRIGRQGGTVGSLAGLLNAWLGGVDLPPVVLIDQRVAYRYLQKIASQIDQPVVEADLHLEGTQVVYTPGKSGRLLNVDATMTSLLAQLQSQKDGEVTLVLEEEAPAVEDASAAAETLRQILSSPLMLTIPNAQAGDPAPWTIDPSQLVGMLIIQRVQAGSGLQYQISVNAQPVQVLLDQIAVQVNQDPQNARFYFDDPTRQLVLIQSAIPGRILDEQATLQVIQSGLLRGEHTLPLQIVVAKPQVGDDATAASLGITELVSEPVISYFRGSSTDREQNIIAASARFHGLLIAPKTTFSMASALGDVSLENGYAEAPIIFNGRSIMGVGGGVCQVSTTLFRAAFFGGYPIVERHYHTYRVKYYEQTATGHDANLAGLDATVFVPLVDLKFTNDRPYWLLMEVYVDTELKKITWKFYSTRDGRTVEIHNLGLQNVVPAPDPLLEEKADLVPHTMVQVEWPADGSDVTVIRNVYREGVMLFSDSIQTHYEPWQAVCQYGPGTRDPLTLAKELDLCQP